MKSLSLKTQILNQFREIAKWQPIESFLVERTQNRTLNSLFPKLIPNYYQYPSGTIRQAERNGVNFQLDISDYMEYIIYYGINVEPRDKLYGLVKNGFVVLDIGANIGETLLNFAKINSKGRNIGFEPVPYIYSRLKKNLSLNNFSNIEIENIALSDKNEQLSFSIPKDQNSGGVRMRKEAHKSDYGADQEVRAIQLDDFLGEKGINKIDFIKMDVEGFEMNVLKGAENSLRKFLPVLFIEVDDVMLKQQETSAAQLVEFVSTLGYTVINADTDSTVIVGDDLTNCHFDIICHPKK